MFIFEKKSMKHFDLYLMIAIVVLFAFGLFVLGSALQISIDPNGSIIDVFMNNKVYLKQIIGFVMGMVLLILVSFVRYELMKDLYILIYIANLLFLGLVLVMGVGDSAARWIAIGPIRLQPSEFAKIMHIVFLAKVLDKHHGKVNDFRFLIVIAILTLIPTALIILQPDLSTSLVFIALLASALFISNLNIKYIGIALLIALPIVTFVIWDAYQGEPIFLKGYQALRIQALFNPEKFANAEAYQTMKSIEAIGSGMLNGKGLFDGTISQRFLPEPQTDFIFAVLGEEFGFVGGIVVIGCLFVIISRILWIGVNAPDLFGKLICTGVGTMIGFQTFVNIGVATGILPNTGIPLPFVSYGLSSLWSNMIGIGLVLNVAMKRNLSYTRR